MARRKQQLWRLCLGTCVGIICACFTSSRHGKPQHQCTEETNRSIICRFFPSALATRPRLNAPLLLHRLCHYRYREIISSEGDREVGSQIYRYMAILATVRSVGAFENGWELLQALYPGHKAIAYLKRNYIARKKKWALAYRDPNDETTNNIVEVRDPFHRWLRVSARAPSLSFVSRACCTSWYSCACRASTVLPQHLQTTVPRVEGEQPP